MSYKTISRKYWRPHKVIRELCFNLQNIHETFINQNISMHIPSVILQTNVSSYPKVKEQKCFEQ